MGSGQPPGQPGHSSLGQQRGPEMPQIESPIEDVDIPEDELFPVRKVSRWERIWLRCRAFVRVNSGLLLVAASQAFFSLMYSSVKVLNSIDPPVSAIQLVGVRMSITYVCCVLYMLWAQVPDPWLGPKGVRFLLVTRGATGFVNLFAVYFSLQYLSLSDATVLTFLVPMCTAVAGALLLGEAFSKKQALAAVVSLVGVILIARPASLFGEAGEILHSSGTRVVTPAQRVLAVWVALIGVLGATGAYTCLRAIGKRAHPLHALVSFSGQCVIISFTTMLISGERFIVPGKVEWLVLFVLIGVFGLCAQILLTLGFQRETVSRGSMAVYTQIVFATAFERIFFKAVPSVLSGVGTVIIISSAMYIALSKEMKPLDASKEAPTVNLRRRVSEEAALEQGLLEPQSDHSAQPRHDKRNSNHKETASPEGRHSSDVELLDPDRDLVIPVFKGPDSARLHPDEPGGLIKLH